MHGREGEDRKRRRHMWPVPAPGSPAAAAGAPPPVALPSDSLQPAADSFLKDGRQIRVGDCALFQAGNAPPFIGIIRRFSTGKEDCLKLCVNWLYRPADVKLAKGILLEAAPNEVFYSFHKDVISAAFLLHPCKVAFLRKGVELPSGISSFVCRRVYDIANKCLWWLTDQDYINEHQEEVDQLLDKTRLEMHAAVQSGGRSPKPLNGPTSSQQLKSGSDSVQNSGTSFPSQVKGKKRDRGDQGTEPIKRERPTKTDDVDSAGFRLDNMIKMEIAKITEKGALTNTEGVEKLVNLMQIDRNERKIDLAGRVLLADVIAATDRIDCLARFVQLKGVPVLDEWLQEVHRGKTGDGSSPKESDKATDEFLLALLRALDRLPVNLNALQTCHIGKSVNHLRSHKNLEIQRKARSLVDTWKKRVDAEMTKINEVSHSGTRRAGSNEAATVKSAISQTSTCKALVGKPGHADAIVKSTPVAPGSLKLPSSLPAAVPLSSKDSPCKAAGSSGTSELPPTTVKEEKSSGSSQSQNNSQSCSSDHAKTMASSWKEDARSSSAGSMNANKSSGGSSRHRRSSNGFLGSSIAGVQKENNLGKLGSINRTATLDKVASQSGLTCERTLDMPGTDHGNSHRLIVRLPNPGRSPARSASGCSLDDPSVTGSRGSSPGAPDRHDHGDRKVRKGDACRTHLPTDVNAESWQSNDVKEGLVGSDEGDRSPAAIPDEERSRGADETGRVADASRAACSLGNEKGVSLVEPKMRNSFSSINALIESCANYSEPTAPLSAGDDIGMNLLASVAAGEISKSDVVSPFGSPGSSPVKEDPCTGNNEAKSTFSCEDGVAQSRDHSEENADFDSQRHGKSVGFMLARDELKETNINVPDDSKAIMPLQDNKLKIEQTGQHPVSSVKLHKTEDICPKSEVKSEEKADRCLPAHTTTDVKEEQDGSTTKQQLGGQRVSGKAGDDNPDGKIKVRSPSMDETKSNECSHEKIAEGSTKASDAVCNSSGDACDNESAASSRKPEKLIEQSSLCPPFSNEVPKAATLIEQQLPRVAENHTEAVDRSGNDAVASSAAEKVVCSENADESKTKRSDSLEEKQLEQTDIKRSEPTSVAPSNIDEQSGSAAASVGTNNGVEAILEIKEHVEKNNAVGLAAHGHEPSPPPSTVPVQEAELTGPKREDHASSAEASSFVVTSEADVAAKLDFDLNEGLPGDDGNQSEPVASAASVCSSAIRLPSISPFASCSLSNGPPAPITVAAPAKGPFVPPENLLKSKGQPGWKGSAATSAFRPAEPRKVLEMLLNTADAQSSDTAAGKQSRPPLDIDLNVPDERVLEDMASQGSPQTTGSESGVISNRDAPVRAAGGLDLDLNRVDEGTDNGQFLASSSRRLEVPLLPVRPASGGFPNGEANMLRDFDLNNGPGLDEVGTEPLPKSQHAKSSSNVPLLPPIAGLRMSNAELGNASSWFPPGNSYPAVAIPSFLPDRGEQPYPIVAAAGAQRILGSVTGGGTFGGDIYRGQVLSSSPAMAFSPAAAFPYGSFPFGSSFPLTSTSFSGGGSTYVDSSLGGVSCFPSIPSQHMGPAGAVSSHYARPYVVSLPEGSTSGGSESSRKWGRHGLDLNAGPGSADVEAKDDRLPSASRQLPIASSQAFVEEQARIYQVASGLKRKEPEGGWDERFVYKQHSRQ